MCNKNLHVYENYCSKWGLEVKKAKKEGGGIKIDKALPT